MRRVTKENLIVQIDRLRKIKDEQGQLSMTGEYTLQAYEMLLATMEAESSAVTVKLPESFRLAKSSSGLTYYYADEVDAALAAAGIKVEDE
ncbi:hypothetical protein AXX01_00008 [Acinetobacter phage LAPP1]|nr:hypothetical protein AXX01_00008 [Acinetobacter phage JC1]